MLKRSWHKWMAFLTAGGAVLLQIPACTETAIAIGSAASVVTAAGVGYIVWRVLE